jgi:hypothetical protein
MAKSSFEGFPSPRPDKKGTSGKLYASGSLTSSSSTTNFTDSAGAVQAHNYVSVSGLIFPSGIDTILVNAPGNGQDNTFYSSHLLTASNAYILFGGGGSPKWYQLIGASVNNTSFLLPVATPSFLYNWYVWGL